jgi:hypothetical protein
MYGILRRAAYAAVAVVAAGSLGMATPALARPAHAHDNELIKMSTPSPMIYNKVTATGVIHDTGWAYSPPRPQRWYILKLSHGTVRYAWKVTASSHSQNLRTCTRTYRELGTITLSHGTGSYRHLYGSGRYVTHGINSGDKLPGGRCFFTPDEWRSTTIARGSVAGAPARQQ